MNRRKFLATIAAGTAGLILDPEQLLWRRTKTIFLPPARAGVITLTPAMVRSMTYSLKGLFNPNLEIAKMYRESFVTKGTVLSVMTDVERDTITFRVMDLPRRRMPFEIPRFP